MKCRNRNAANAAIRGGNSHEEQYCISLRQPRSFYANHMLLFLAPVILHLIVLLFIDCGLLPWP
jgi:hypothetical protein